MADVTASRTLVKSTPELWTECSEAASLGRHLDRFGQIRITRLEPETAVAWEGELASGTVRLEPSGWGTRVVLTATPAVPSGAVLTATPAVPSGGGDPACGHPQPDETGADLPEVPSVASEPVAAARAAPPAAAAAPARRGFLGRLFGGWGRRAVAEPAVPEPKAPTPVPEQGAPVPDPAAPVREPVDTVAASVPGSPPGATPRAAPLDPGAALAAALDSLGQAHHRPFSRS